MKERVKILGFSDEVLNKLEVKQEGTLIKFSTHIHGDCGYIKSHEIALVQLDDGTFKTVSINLIRLKK